MSSPRVPPGGTSGGRPRINPGVLKNLAEGIAASDYTSIEAFGLTVVVIIAFFTVLNFLNRWSLDTSPKQKSSLHRTYLVSRMMITRFTAKKCLLFPSIGHLIFFAVYVLINMTLVITNIDLTSGTLSMIGVAKRLGWLAVGNMCLTFVLAIKNTPLSFLTSFSYEKLNVLHQVTGYMTATLAVLHGTIFTIACAKLDVLFAIYATHQRFGIAAGIMILIIAGTSRILIRRNYELFYLTHILFVIAILIMVYYHRPWIQERTSILIFVCGGIFGLDKLIRYLKYAYYGHGTQALVVPIANGSTRITLNRSLPRTKAASHAFLWLPRINALQSHPCTMISTNPVSFILTGAGDFTKALNQYASQRKNATIAASFDAPYGAVPAFEKYSRVLLLAGGSGATWTVAVAMDLLARGLPTVLEFIWVVKDSETLSWFGPELMALHKYTNVNIWLYCTGDLPEFDAVVNPSAPSPRNTIPPGTKMEKAFAASYFSSRQRLMPGRPDVARILSNAMQGMGKYDRIFVGACGPRSMLNKARNAAVEANAKGGAVVDLHVESHGW